MRFGLAAIDLDNTLLDYDAEEARACGILCGEISRMFEVTVEEALASYQRAKRIERDSGDVRSAVLGRFDELVKMHAWPKGTKSILFQAYVEQRLANCHVIPGAHELIQTAADCAGHVVIITNGLDSLQRQRLERVGLSGFVEQLFASSAVGYRKPDRRFFEMVEKITGVPIADWLVLGDDYAVDLALPAKRGATAILVDDTAAVNVRLRNLRTRGADD